MDRDDLFGPLREAIEAGAAQALGSLYGLEGPFHYKFETPPDPAMGHLALACFPFAKAAKTGPPIIAQALAQALGSINGLAEARAVGPYLNFFLSPRYLADRLLTSALMPDFGNSSQGKGQRLLLEYSSPNTNKPLHLGHGRNNLLGMALASLSETQGFEVIKVNLVNDRGIHICKSMLAYQTFGQSETPESSGLKGDKLVGKYYVEYDKRSKLDPRLEDQAAQMLRDWEAEVPEVRSLWRTMNDWVLAGFQETYDRLGCQFDQLYFESETYQSGREIVLKAQAEGRVEVEDNGALSIDLTDIGLDKKILLRGDGTSMYITQDLGTTVKKYADFYFDHHFFVVGNEQDYHFKVLFEVLKRFGYDWAARLEHLSYGMITLPEGKMKSREGTVVDLDDLLDEMKALAQTEIESREIFGPKEQDLIGATAEWVGQGAVKYFILKSGAAREMQFNPKESLSFDGQTGPYLQYTHARISSLAKRAQEVELGSKEGYAWSGQETELLVQLGRFYELLQFCFSERNPAPLCTYLYELARNYNKYYYDQPVLKAEPNERRARLDLGLAVQAVLAKGLKILGIEPLKRM